MTSLIRGPLGRQAWPAMVALLAISGMAGTELVGCRRPTPTAPAPATPPGDLEDLKRKITPRTKGIVVINPNNPTGALYSDELLKALVQIAREHGLVILADEVYDKVLYDGVRHTAIASLSEDVLTLTFNSLSKSYRS